MAKPPIVNDRNVFGVKYSSDQYRTFKGEHYLCWVFGRYPEDLVSWAKAYRDAGLRCRRLGGDLYLHHEDQEKALALDKAAGRE